MASRNPKHYPKNYITNALVRLDFVENVPSQVKDSLKKELHVKDGDFSVKTIHRKSIDLRDGRFENEVVGTQAVFKVESGRFELTNDAFVYMVESYTTFECFLSEFSRGLDALLRVLQEPPSFQRVGLRYINDFRVKHIKKPSQWEPYFNRKFMGSLKTLEAPVEGFLLLRNMNTFNFKSGEVAVTLKTGLWNDEFPVPFGANNFIVDIDCYIESLIFDHTFVQKQMPRLNKVAFDFFSKVGSNTLRRHLEGHE